MKPPGLSTGLHVIRATRAEDAIWSAVEAAIVENMTVRAFIAEARKGWDYANKIQAKLDDREFDAAMADTPRET